MVKGTKRHLLSGTKGKILLRRAREKEGQEFSATGELQRCGVRNSTKLPLSCKAWAQAVKVDRTVIFLHSGNCELVCLRHRDTKTLYVSDLIEPPTCKDPGYGKLHVGIYVAGIQDAIDHQKQQQQRPTSPPDDGDDDSAGGDSSEDINTLIQVAAAKVVLEVKEVALVMTAGKEREAGSKARQVKKMLILMSL